MHGPFRLFYFGPLLALASPKKAQLSNHTLEENEQAGSAGLQGRRVPVTSGRLYFIVQNHVIKLSASKQTGDLVAAVACGTCMWGLLRQQSEGTRNS